MNELLTVPLLRLRCVDKIRRMHQEGKISYEAYVELQEPLTLALFKSGETTTEDNTERVTRGEEETT